MPTYRPVCFRFPVRFVVTCAVAVSLAAALAGCGDGRPERVPVSGVVLLDGVPLKAAGTVRVIPKGARPATGEIDPASGRFTLGTFDKADGCVPGTHTVTVIARQTVDDKQIHWLTPEKYSQPGSSGLTITVDGPTDQVKLELKSEAAKPPEQNAETAGDVDPSKL